MCDTTKTIEAHPTAMRQLVEIIIAADKAREAIVKSMEDANGREAKNGG